MLKRPIFLIIFLLGATFGIGRSISLAKTAQPPRSTANLPLGTAPTCYSICDMSGINFAHPERQPTSDYLRAERLGMGWELEIAYNPYLDLLRTSEAMNRAIDHNLHPILRVCDADVSKCGFTNPQTYSDFLHNLAPMVKGEFWSLFGPNEPDLEKWARDDSICLSTDPYSKCLAGYMNSMLTLTGDIPTLHSVSPAFSSTNPATEKLFNGMESYGAQFGALDAFASTTYTVSGNGAYYYYASNTGFHETMRHRAARFHKKVIFVEYGTFGMFDKPKVGDPRRATIVQQMRSEFAKAANDTTVMAILHFDAFGTNGTPHKYYDPEMITIAKNLSCLNGSQRQAGVGLAISTTQTLWSSASTPGACQEWQYGCPFLTAIACDVSTSCVDNDGDHLYGDGGTCTRTDCEDSDPAIAESCAPGIVPDTSSGWGTLSIIDSSTADHDTDIWPVVGLRQNGLPMIAYHHDVLGYRDLNIMECLTADCTSSLRRVLASDDYAGMHPSIAIGQDGNPVIVHYDLIDEDLEVLACADLSCLTGQTHIIDYEPGAGVLTSIVIRADGRPLIAYWRDNGDDLYLYNCADAICSTGASRSLDSGQFTGRSPSIFLRSNGTPMIAYEKATSPPRIKIYNCADSNCASGGSYAGSDFDAAASEHGSVLRLDGRAAFVFRNPSDGHLVMTDCNNSVDPQTYCKTWHDSQGWHFGWANRELDTGGDFYDPAVTLLYDGNPFIAYREDVGGTSNLKLMRCFDPSCISNVTQMVVNGGVGRHPDIVRLPNGNPLITFFDLNDPEHGKLGVFAVDLSLIEGGFGLPPDPPTDFAATSDGYRHINLSWTTNNTLRESSFKLERSTNQTDWEDLTTLPANAASYADTVPVCGTIYYYRLTGIRLDGQSSSSVEANTTTDPCPPAPDTPSGFAAAPFNHKQIDLSWIDSPDETGYLLRYSTDLTNWTNLPAINADAVNYSHSPVDCDTLTYYQLLAHRESDGQYSAPAEASAQAMCVPPPNAPTELTVVLNGRTQIDLNWIDNASGTAIFKVERSLDGEITWEEIGTASIPSYTDMNRECETTYNYRVRAYDAHEDQYSEYSETASATTADCLSALPVPLLSKPKNGVAVYTATPKLIWRRVRYALKYHLQVSTDPTFETGLAIDTDSLTAYYLTPLASALPYGTYFWRVKAFDGTHWTAYSLPYQFDLTRLKAPKKKADVYTPQPKFVWAAVLGATGYHLQVATDSTFDSGLVIDTDTAVPYYLTPLGQALPYGTYYWRVQANQGVSTPYTPTWLFQRTLLRAPTNGVAVRTLLPRFVWLGVSGAVQYHLQVATDPIFDSGVVIDQTRIVPYYQSLVADGLDYGRYYWRVQVDTGSGFGDFTPARTFDITNLYAPKKGAFTLKTPKFVWLAVPGSTSYKIQVDDDEDFSSPVIDQSGLLVRYLISPISLGQGKYYWRVITSNGKVMPAWTFTVGP